jgi:pimeloyl-ACP methyl ester carboxylesterase
MLPVRVDQVNGLALRYARLGTGHPFILLHGYPDNLQLWSAVAPLLAPGFDVIAVDWPGMGMSEAWPGGATPFDMAARLITLLDHWQIDRAAVAGVDMGGQPALVAAARHPDRISHVVVSGSLLQWDAQTSWEIALLRRFNVNQLALGRFPRLVFRRALGTFLPGANPIDAAVREDFWDCFRRDDVRRFVIRMCAGYQGSLPKLPEGYRRIKVPTLALWGERDAHFPPVHAVRLGDQVRGSKITVMNGGWHWLPLQMPSEFAEAVRGFLRASPRISRITAYHGFRG